MELKIFFQLQLQLWRVIISNVEGMRNVLRVVKMHAILIRVSIRLVRSLSVYLNALSWIRRAFASHFIIVSIRRVHAYLYFVQQQHPFAPLQDINNWKIFFFSFTLKYFYNFKILFRNKNHFSINAFWSWILVFIFSEQNLYNGASYAVIDE